MALKETQEHKTKIKATRDGKQRTFSLYEWNMMPADKYGWSKSADKPAAVAEKDAKKKLKDAEAAQKSAQQDFEKAQKNAEKANQTYLEVTQSGDAERISKEEPQAMMKKDDAERALHAAEKKLAEANSALTAAQQ
jgi:hypothetical protein